MSGANNIGPRVTTNNVTTVEKPKAAQSSAGSFSDVLNRVSNDPKSSFFSLGKVLQSNQLSVTDRQVACQNVIAEALGSNSPYQALTKDQSFMEAITGVLADDPRLSSMIERHQFGKV